MERFVEAIRNAIKQKNWYAALFMALTLPDICGRLENPKNGSEARYVAWWKKYLEKKYTNPPNRFRQVAQVNLSGGDVYALRCALLHEGQDDILNQRARVALSKFHFITPPANGVIHGNYTNNAMQLQVDIFCNDICEGVLRWLEDTKGNETVKAGLDAIITIHDSDKGFDIGIVKIAPPNKV